MPASKLGRKSLSEYGSIMSESSPDKEHSSTPRSVHFEETVSSFDSSTNQATNQASAAASRSPLASRLRSASPRKSPPGKLYPDIDVNRPYDSSHFKYTANLYPQLDRNAHSTEYDQEDDDDATIDQSTEYVYHKELGENVIYESTRPVAPVRQRRGQGDGLERGRTTKPLVRNVHLPVKISQPSQTPMWILIGFLTLLTCVLIYVAWKSMEENMTADQIALRDFERNFTKFNQNYNQEIHKDSMRLLHSALRNHVKVASNTDRGNQYPTCILLAADKASGAGTLNCLANDIARMIPATGNVDPAHNVHVVDLTVRKFNHKNPDEEDLRSRVHHGINQGLNEGAKVIVFRNIEALVPDDMPLMNLFYSYCDGEYPTFPKTLWILTLGTENLPVLKAGNFAAEENVARSMSGKVEKYLEDILEGVPAEKKVPIGNADKRTRNPILTRIANYIVPILNVGRTLDTCAATF